MAWAMICVQNSLNQSANQALCLVRRNWPGILHYLSQASNLGLLKQQVFSTANVNLGGSANLKGRRQIKVCTILNSR